MLHPKKRWLKQYMIENPELFTPSPHEEIHRKCARSQNHIQNPQISPTRRAGPLVWVPKLVAKVAKDSTRQETHSSSTSNSSPNSLSESEMRKIVDSTDFLRNVKRGPIIQSVRRKLGSYLPIQITEVNSLSDFYIQRQPMLEDLKSLQEAMSVWYNVYDEYYKNFPMKFENLVPWGYYAAKPLRVPKLSNGDWVRVQVCKKPRNNLSGAYCTLIDFGDQQFFECERIRPLRKCYTALPWVARQAELCTIGQLYSRRRPGFMKANDFREIVETARELKENLLAYVLHEDLRQSEKRPFPSWKVFVKAQNQKYNFIEMMSAFPLNMVLKLREEQEDEDEQETNG